MAYKQMRVPTGLIRRIASRAARTSARRMGGGNMLKRRYMGLPLWSILALGGLLWWKWSDVQTWMKQRKTSGENQ